MGRRNIYNKKTKVFACKLSEEEYRTLMDKAERSAVTPSEFVRRLIRNKKLKYHPPIIHNDTKIVEALNLVSKEAANINQIARYCNEKKSIGPDIVDFLIAAMRDIRSNCIKLSEAIDEEYHTG